MMVSLRSLITALCIVLLGFTIAGAQKTRGGPAKATASSPTVSQIDLPGLKTLLKPDGKPRLINFWATWCDPCREEFPELVRINAAYRGRLDFITVSLDDLEDIQTTVP